MLHMRLQKMCGMFFKKVWYWIGQFQKVWCHCIPSYLMADDKFVISQSHELQKITYEVLSKGMKLCEQFQVSILINKLSYGWKDFRKTPCHSSKEFSMMLIIWLRIGDDSRKQDKNKRFLLFLITTRPMHM